VRFSRELWLWLGGLFVTLFGFLAAIAIAYFLKEPGYSLFGNPWMPLAIVSFLIGFGAFFAAASGRDFPQSVKSIKPGFPDVTVDIQSIGSTDTERESSTGMDVPAHLRSFNVRFKNAEHDRSANIEATMYVKLIAGSWGRAAEAVCPPPSWALPSSLGLNPIPMPLLVEPDREASGQLVFEIPRYYVSKMANPVAARLELTDHVTGRRVSIPAELGRYERSAMTPTTGGAEVLGPEFETQPDVSRDQAMPGTAVEQA
jgi:hypothetical protein